MVVLKVQGIGEADPLHVLSCFQDGIKKGDNGPQPTERLLGTRSFTSSRRRQPSLVRVEMKLREEGG